MFVVFLIIIYTLFDNRKILSGWSRNDYEGYLNVMIIFFVFDFVLSAATNSEKLKR